MKFYLHTFTNLEAAISQYDININKPVELSLHGTNSYCVLKGIENPKLKEVLIKVGKEFEQSHNNTFFNFYHTFSLVKEGGIEDSEDFVSDIFAYVKEQTKDHLDLDLTDIKKIDVKKAEDRSFVAPRRAFALSIDISEKALETAQTSGLVFKEYLTTAPKGAVVIAMGVGQIKI